MKVSIIVPVYNVEKYIDRCFDSIMNQTYTNIECIFIDDASPDNCYEIISHRIVDYSGEIDFRLIRHSENIGLSGARNTGTIASTGKYIYYLDSDDEITPDCIHLLLKIALNYKGVEIVQGNTLTFPEPKLDWRNLKLKNFPEYVNEKKWIRNHCLIQPRIPVNAWNKLINREFLIKNNLLFREGIIHEDEHWFFFVSKKLTSIAFSKKYCYIHNILPGSIMQSGSNYKSIESWLIILNELSLNVDNEFATSEKNYIFNRIRFNMQRINVKNDEKKFITEYRSLIKQNLLLSAQSFEIIECFALLMLLLPHPIYSSFIGRNITGLLMRLM